MTDSGTITPAPKSVTFSRSSGYHFPPRCFRHCTTILSDIRPANGAPTANAKIDWNLSRYQAETRGTQTHVTKTGREETGPDDSFVRDVISYALRGVVNAKESRKLWNLSYHCICKRDQENLIRDNFLVLTTEKLIPD